MDHHQKIIQVLLLTMAFTLTSSKTMGHVDLEPTSPSTVTSAHDPPLDPCSKVTQFAKDVSSFYSCSIIDHLSLCRTCMNDINQLTASYVALETLLRDPLVIPLVNHTSCAESILSDSTMETVNSYYTHARSVWVMANCDSEYLSIFDCC